MLLDDYSSTSKNENVNKLQVIKRFLQVLLDSGLSQREAEKHLKQEEKELLEEAKYMDARKKEFGRKWKARNSPFITSQYKNYKFKLQI